MKKILISVIILGIIFISFSSFTLVKTNYRNQTFILPNSIKTEIKNTTLGMDEMDIVNYSIKYTASYLNFSKNNNILKHKANCIGYAQLCSAICNYSLRINHLKGYAKPVIGYVEYNSINICQLLQNICTNKWKSFVKNHDFVEFYFGNDLIYADACAYDLIKTDCKTIKHK